MCVYIYLFLCIFACPQLGLSERIAHEIELYANMNAHNKIRIGTIACNANARQSTSKQKQTQRHTHMQGLMHLCM